MVKVNVAVRVFRERTRRGPSEAGGRMARAFESAKSGVSLGEGAGAGVAGLGVGYACAGDMTFGHVLGGDESSTVT